MQPCPKCETLLRKDAARCPVCGTPQSLAVLRPGARDVGDPLIDPLLDLFERQEPVHYCPVCLNEFREDQTACRRCGGVPLEVLPRDAFEAALLKLPVRSLGERIAAGPPPTPRDLVRVRVAPDLEDAQACLLELRSFGIEAAGGSDVLDPFTEPGRIGIYVRAPDREVAEYLLSGYERPDPLMRPPIRDRPPRAARLAEALGYQELGKYRDVVRLADLWPGDAALETLAIDALLLGARLREAAARAQEAAARVADRPFDRGCLLARAALVRALGFDGTPFGRGSDLPEARRLAELAVSLAPRSLEAARIRIEIAAAAGGREALREALEHAERLNPNLLSRTGPYRTLRDRL